MIDGSPNIFAEKLFFNARRWIASRRRWPRCPASCADLAKIEEIFLRYMAPTATYAEQDNAVIPRSVPTCSGPLFYMPAETEDREREVVEEEDRPPLCARPCARWRKTMRGRSIAASTSRSRRHVARDAGPNACSSVATPDPCTPPRPASAARLGWRHHRPGVPADRAAQPDPLAERHDRADRVLTGSRAARATP